MLLMQQPRFLGFGRLEEFVEYLKPGMRRPIADRTVYLMHMIVPGLLGDVGEAAVARHYLVIQGDDEHRDKIAYVSIYLDNGEPVHDITWEASRTGPVYARCLTAKKIVAEWLAAQGLRVVEATYAMPDDYPMLQGRADFLVWDREERDWTLRLPVEEQPQPPDADTPFRWSPGARVVAIDKGAAGVVIECSRRGPRHFKLPNQYLVRFDAKFGMDTRLIRSHVDVGNSQKEVWYPETTLEDEPVRPAEPDRAVDFRWRVGDTVMNRATREKATVMARKIEDYSTLGKGAVYEVQYGTGLMVWLAEAVLQDA